MKEFTNKTLEDALQDASVEMGTPVDELIYKVIDEKKGLFSKKTTIEVYSKEDAAESAKDYLVAVVEALGVHVESCEYTFEEDVIRLTLESDNNKILIGRKGKTLEALKVLTRLAISNKFHHRYRLLIDIGGYKEDRYSHLIYRARREAHMVQKTHVSAKLSPMTADERRQVHQALNDMDNITTESEGDGQERHIVIKYVD